MDEKMVKAMTMSVVLGGELLIGCGVFMIRDNTVGDILWLEVMIGLAVFGGGLFEFLGLRQPLKDERAARIGTLAATYSWFTILLLVGSIAMVFGFVGRGKITMPQAAGTILIVMVVSMPFFTWYLGREGDVE